MTSQLWINLILGVGALGSPISLVILLRQRWRKGEGEIRLDKVTETKLANEALAINDKRERDREEVWEKRLADQQMLHDRDMSELRGEMRELRLESDTLKLFIHRHMPWDWDAVRKLTLAGIDHSDPPSLIYLKDEEPPRHER